MYNGEKSNDWEHLQFYVFIHVFNNVLNKSLKTCFYVFLFASQCF